MTNDSRHSGNEPASLPAGVGQVFGFGVLNAMSFQMILSSPMLLYLKSLNAGATVLGIFAGMMPLLVCFQIPAARHVAGVGYKRFVLTGWSVRVAFIWVMALVPLTAAFLTPGTRLALLLFLLFCFNLSRGISSCGWLPWITSIIPARLRGVYLAREAAFSNLASFAAFVFAAFMLGTNPQAWQFSVVFGFSAVAGFLSLSFLRRIPEGESPERIKTSGQPVPWGEIARFAPFRKLLRMNLAWGLAYGGVTAFTVAFLKVALDMPERQILLLTSVSFLGALGSLAMFGSRLDRLGSKPVLAFSLIGWIGILVGWVLIAGRVLQPWIALIVVLQLFMGMFASLVNMANTRLAMAVIPEMGRSHFFALFSVVGNVVLGLSPILWGLIIDAFRPVRPMVGSLELNCYTIYFVGAAVAFLAAFFVCRQLDEPEAASMEALLRDIMEKSPLRFWLRLWPRS